MGLTPGNNINISSSPCLCINSSCYSTYNANATAFIVMVTIPLSLFTVMGNMLVMLSIKVNHNLRTINNYFLFSLAVADLLIGLFSMNLYTLYLVMGQWPLGVLLCDLWLLLDYVVSNASVMNLLLISLDRYLCVTRPLSYPARRTGAMACLMIATAWLLSFFLWAPAILCWQTFPAKRAIPEGQCYIQVLANPAATLGTTLPSFYIPAGIMIFLYSRITSASRSRFCMLQSQQQTMRMWCICKSISPVFSESETNTMSDSLNHVNSDTPLRSRGDQAKVTVNSMDTAPKRLLSSHEEATDYSEINIHCRKRPSKSFTMFSQWQERSRCRIMARERKVTRTVLAILLAFIVTWTPYNVMAIIGTFYHVCVPNSLWVAGYWMCYINSAINPGCYALFNVTFRKTFHRLLLCNSRTKL